MRKWHDGNIVTSHDLAVDSLGRTTKYVYDNPGSHRAVVVVNCSHQFDQVFSTGQAEVKTSLEFEHVPGGDNPIMRLSVVVLMRKGQPNTEVAEDDELHEV